MSGKVVYTARPANDRGPNERAVAAAIRAARAQGGVDERAAGLEALARTMARGVDDARAHCDLRALAQLGPKLADVLVMLDLGRPKQQRSGALDRLMAAMADA